MKRKLSILIHNHALAYRHDGGKENIMTPVTKFTEILEEEDGTKTILKSEEIFINGNHNLIVRMIDPDGHIRRIYEYHGYSADVKYFEKGKF